MASSSSNAAYIRALQARMIQLIGIPTVSINDHSSVKKLQAALIKKAEEEAIEREKHLARQERQRVRDLINRGVLKPGESQKFKVTKTATNSKDDSAKQN